MRKPKVLIAGNHPRYLTRLENILQEMHIETVSVNSEDEILERFKENEFAVAVLDFELEVEGYQLIKKMRRRENTRNLPVISVSSEESINAFLESEADGGVVDFLPKPVKKQLLLNKVYVFTEIFSQRKKLEYEIEKRRQSEYNLKKTERRLIEAKRKAEESDRLKSTFLANMSHEIRTPMNAIIGFANLLGNDELEHEEKGEYINYIQNSSRTLLNLIDDIIDIAKIEAGQLSINPSATSIQSILKELHVSFKKELANRGKSHLDFKLNIPDRKKEDYVYADESRLRQVLSNIINNAIKFTQEGYIEIGYYQIPNADEVMFFVRDTGIGIPEDKLLAIFNRFEQIKDKRIKKNEGTGLGLSISKRIIELMGGEIAVESVVGEGSYFYFTLNLYPEPADEPKKKEVTKPSISSTELNLKGKKILIAEDELFNYQFLKEFLRPTDAEIVRAKSGQEAVEKIKEDPSYSLILMDIKMPEMDGYEATKMIKKIAPEIPIFAQTAYAMTGEKKSSKNAGFNEYLTKPIKTSELLKLIVKYIPTKFEVKNT